MKARFIYEQQKFLKGSDPFRIMNIGSNRLPKIGDVIKILGSNNKIVDASMWPNPGTIIKILQYWTDGYIVSDHGNMEDEEYAIYNEWFQDPTHNWEFLIDESLEFKLGGNPYRKLNIGSEKTKIVIFNRLNIPDIQYIKRYKGDNLHYYHTNTKDKFLPGLVNHVGQIKHTPWYEDLNNWLHRKGELKPAYFNDVEIFIAKGVNQKNNEIVDITEYNVDSNSIIILIKNMLVNSVKDIKIKGVITHRNGGEYLNIPLDIIEQFKQYINENNRI